MPVKSGAGQGGGLEVSRELPQWLVVTEASCPVVLTETGLARYTVLRERQQPRSARHRSTELPIGNRLDVDLLAEAMIGARSGDEENLLTWVPASGLGRSGGGR